MNDGEAVDLLWTLMNNIESEQYALYYVGMMDEKERLLIALQRGIDAINREAAVVQQTPAFTIYPRCGLCGINHDPNMICIRMSDGTVALNFTFNEPDTSTNSD